MEIIPVKTRKLLPPQDDLFAILEESLPALHEGDIVCIASKVVAIHQGRVVSRQSVVGSEETNGEKRKERDAPLLPKADKGVGGDLDDEKRKIILSEAQWVDDETKPFLTIKNGQFIPFAGVDESNGNGHYVLWPSDPMGMAREIREFLLNRIAKNPSPPDQVRGRPYPLPQGGREIPQLGVIITDSTCLPLRSGTVGTAIGFAGFEPVKDYRGKKDLFDRTLELSRVNVADSLAAAATLVMGEGDESTPLVLIRAAVGITFTDADHSADVKINPADDIFAPILSTTIPSSPSLPSMPVDWSGDRPFFTLVAVSSLDGIIAPHDKKVEGWASAEDQHWFHSLLPTFDATVMGRSTYALLPHDSSKRNRVVLTSTVEDLDQIDASTWFLNPQKADLIAFLKERGWKNVGVSGGGETYSFFVRHEWTDRILLTLEPLVSGEGIRLFSREIHRRFRLVRLTRLNADGTLLCQYEAEGC